MSDQTERADWQAIRDSAVARQLFGERPPYLGDADNRPGGAAISGPDWDRYLTVPAETMTVRTFGYHRNYHLYQGDMGDESPPAPACQEGE